MKLSTKGKLAAIGIAGALTLAASTPSMAYWRHGQWYGPAAVAGGIAAGTLLGAAAVASGGYGPGYGPAPGYYQPGYAYAPGPGYANDYAYAPGPAAGSCFVKTDPDRGFGYMGSCATRDRAINSATGNLETDNQYSPY